MPKTPQPADLSPLAEGGFENVTIDDRARWLDLDKRTWAERQWLIAIWRADKGDWTKLAVAYEETAPSAWVGRHLDNFWRRVAYERAAARGAPLRGAPPKVSYDPPTETDRALHEAVEEVESRKWKQIWELRRGEKPNAKRLPHGRLDLVIEAVAAERDVDPVRLAYWVRHHGSGNRTRFR